MPKADPAVKAEVRRRLIDGDFKSLAGLARDADITEPTLRNWRIKWAEDPEYSEGEKVANPTPWPTPYTEAMEAKVETPPPTIEMPPSASADEFDAEMERLRTELASAERRAAMAEARVGELDPTLYMPLFTDYESAVKWFGEQGLKDQAYGKQASEAIKRRKAGLPEITYTEDQMQDMMRAIVDARLRQKTMHRGRRGRVQKMAKRFERTSPQTPSGWTLVQVPVEEQMYNEKAHAGLTQIQFREKGAKLILPYLCQAVDCWEFARADSNGKPVLDGYCREECRSLDPYLTAVTNPGVSTSRQFNPANTLQPTVPRSDYVVV